MSIISKVGQFVNFSEIGDTGKTKRFSVTSKGNDLLGHVQWFGAWRKYCFYPSANTIWDTKCLFEVMTFIGALMNERKQK